MSRTALITGISGQDGAYLAELLRSKDYDVHGIMACSKPGIGDPPAGTYYADLADGSNLGVIIAEVCPDEIYNLAAQSHVRLSFDLPLHTANVTGLGTLRLLEAVRVHQERTGQQVRFYQASSSEMFGQARESPQNEGTPFHPRSPYACAKVYAFWQTVNYREAYGMFACNGILFNHESPRRGEAFVTRKITRAATRIKLGLQERLSLGNLDSKRDWGFAQDFVEAMWLMLQQEEPADYVVATGQIHSVRDFLDTAFNYLELDWRDHVDIDERLLRPSEVHELCGDASKASRKLGWKPKVQFNELVKIMIEHDLQLAIRERDHGGG